MKKIAFSVVCSVLLSCLAAYAVAKAIVPSNESAVVSGFDGNPVRTVNLSMSDYPDFTYAAETAVDAVVYVKVTLQSRQQYDTNDPFFRFFFGDQFNAPGRERQGSGSGVIIRSDGYIVTNNHVVQGATKVEVTLNNNKTYTATVVGSDPATDVALVKIDADNLPVVEIADSDKLRLGEWVLAIGSPLGEELRSTITAGIVSAKGRSMPNYTGEFKIESFIQTDAAVNPGNSGGALVNKAGQLVGINTAIISTTGSYSGYSFAVPSNIVKKIVGDLIDFGSVKRARLGVAMRAIDEKTAEEMKLSSLLGVYIEEVSKGSAADAAGLRKGDVVTAIDSTVIKSPAGLQEKVNGFHPGDEAEITFLRGGKVLKAKVTFQGTSDGNGTVSEDGSVVFYGAKLKAAHKGVAVVSAGNGKFAQAGGQDGDLIQYVNDQKVRDPMELIEIAKKARRSVFVEGVTAAGRPFFFGFGKDE